MSVLWIALFVIFMTCVAINFSCALYVGWMLDDNRELGNIVFFSFWRGHLLTVFIAGWHHTDKPGMRWVMRVWSVALVIPLFMALVWSFLY